MASREERFLMRQRGAGRQLQTDDDDFALTGMAPREERFLMRQRGAGRQLKGDDDDFMLALPGAPAPAGPAAPSTAAPAAPTASAAAQLASEALAVDSTDQAPEAQTTGGVGALPGTAAQRAQSAKRQRRERSLTPRQQADRVGDAMGSQEAAEERATLVDGDGVATKKRRMRLSNGFEPVEAVAQEASEDIENGEAGEGGEQENEKTVERQTSQPASSGKKKKKRRSVGQQSMRRKRLSAGKTRVVEPPPAQAGGEEPPIDEEALAEEDDDPIEQEDLPEDEEQLQRAHSSPVRPRKPRGINIADARNSQSDDEAEMQTETPVSREESLPSETAAVTANDAGDGQDGNAISDLPDFTEPNVPVTPEISDLIRDMNDGGTDIIDQSLAEPGLEQDGSDAGKRFITPPAEVPELAEEQFEEPSIETSPEQNVALPEEDAGDEEEASIAELDDQAETGLAEAVASSEPRKQRGRPPAQGGKRKKRKSVLLPKKRRVSDIPAASTAEAEQPRRGSKARQQTIIEDTTEAQDSPATEDAAATMTQKRRGRPPKTLRQHDLPQSQAASSTVRKRKPGRPARPTSPDEQLHDSSPATNTLNPARSPSPTTEPQIEPRPNTIPILTSILTLSDLLPSISSLPAISHDALPPLLPSSPPEKPVPTAPEVLAQVSSEIMDNVRTKLRDADAAAGLSSKASRRRQGAMKAFGDELVRRLREMGRLLKANGVMARRVKHGKKLRRELMDEVLEVRSQREEVDERVFRGEARLELARRVGREDERILGLLSNIEEVVKNGGGGGGGGGRKAAGRVKGGRSEGSGGSSSNSVFELKMLLLQSSNSLVDRDAVEERARRLGQILDRVAAS